MSHTKGPWKHYGRCDVRTLDNKLVANTLWDADARLIAAAPTMLAQLIDARDAIDGMIDVEDGDYGIPKPSWAMRLARELDEVIAQAEGRS